MNDKERGCAQLCTADYSGNVNKSDTRGAPLTEQMNKERNQMTYQVQEGPQALCGGKRALSHLDILKGKKERIEKELLQINAILEECEKRPEAVDLAVKILAAANRY